MISGAAPISVYEAILNTVQYSINATEPDKSTPVRELEVSTITWYLSFALSHFLLQVAAFHFHWYTYISGDSVGFRLQPQQ